MNKRELEYRYGEMNLQRHEAELMARGVTRALATLQDDYDSLNQRRYDLERVCEKLHRKIEKLKRKS